MSNYNDRPLSPLYQEKDFGDLDTPYMPATANQRLNKESLIKERFKQVKALQLDQNHEFNTSTRIVQDDLDGELYDSPKKPIY
jgi:hypothetical protein